MPVQITYNQQDKYQVGVINGVEPHAINSIIAAEEIGFGLPVLSDGSLSLGESSIYGISCAQASVEGDLPYTENESYPSEFAVGVLRKGLVAVLVTDTPAIAGGDVFTNDITGAFGGSTSAAAFTKAENCSYETSAEVGEIALVRISFVAGDGSSSGVTATASAIVDDSLSLLIQVVVDDGGSGYADGPVGVTISAPDGTQANLGNYTGAADGSGTVNIIDGGKGYGTTTVSVTQDFGSGSGTGAAFTAVVTNGAISSITGDGAGSGYDGSETFSITIPNVTQATATATATGGSVVSVTLTDVGEGYGDIPTVTIDAP